MRNSMEIEIMVNVHHKDMSTKERVEELNKVLRAITNYLLEENVKYHGNSFWPEYTDYDSRLNIVAKVQHE